MDCTYSGLTGRDLVETNELLEQVEGWTDIGRHAVMPIGPIYKFLATENFGDECFRAMPE